ncbi:hypothetical protein N7541_007077 [Penicillium brevicompactum]|uniref:Dynactin subunit 6 n=1 Tax=Penicillium brevicompactum TaxID=5074 RepID=A0A9W9QXX4_PENBR|nr:hypothetical protein N7541_007077 [Penicillium brevicompactum]
MATLKPPTNTHRSSSSGPPKAPLKVDSTSTIADNVVFQGPYPVTIGAGTVIHPRAKFYTYEGPIVVGDGCIICEKAVIGAAPPSSSRSSSPSPSRDTEPTRKESTTRISYFVTIGPSSTVEPGAHIHSSATIEALATIRRGADIGSHAKVCSACEITGKVGEWFVVWGNGPGMRRKRARAAKPLSSAVLDAARIAQTAVPAPAPAGKVIEDARLMVLQKEREVLGRMLVPVKKK